MCITACGVRCWPAASLPACRPLPRRLAAPPCSLKLVSAPSPSSRGVWSGSRPPLYPWCCNACMHPSISHAPSSMKVSTKCWAGVSVTQFLKCTMPIRFRLPNHSVTAVASSPHSVATPAPLTQTQPPGYVRCREISAVSRCVSATWGVGRMETYQYPGRSSWMASPQGPPASGTLRS
jgi:hypothetical protein